MSPKKFAVYGLAGSFLLYTAYSNFMQGKDFISPGLEGGLEKIILPLLTSGTDFAVGIGAKMAANEIDRRNQQLIGWDYGFSEHVDTSLELYDKKFPVVRKNELNFGLFFLTISLISYGLGIVYGIYERMLSKI
jgi:hypothetical protein